ncbi:TIGR00730 family Rossman fold protein [bacterium]|nr:TIGR00730 family Rossman fold protein [bacterium]
MSLHSVGVFCGANTGTNPLFAEQARELGHALADRGLGLVYGGGSVGLMGEIANAVLERGGRAVGVIPQHLVDREVSHRGLTKLHIVSTMHERKALMAELSDAFISLPGGFGTLDEMCEILTWAQLGMHAKPMGLLNTAGFYNGFLTFLDQAVANGFLRPQNRDLIQVAGSVDEALSKVLTYQAPEIPRWIWDRPHV